MLRKFLAIMFIGVSIIAAASSAQAASVMDKSVVIVGTEGTYPPFEFYGDDNTLTGFDVELLALIGPKIGREIKFEDMAFDGLIPSLLTGKIDMIAAALNATEERRKQVAFTDVYQIADASIIVKSDNDTIKDLAGLKGKTIGVQLGTTEDLYLTDANLGAEIKRYQKTGDAVEEILLGRIDGALFDSPVAGGYLDNERFKDKIKIAFKEMINGPEEGFSLAIRKEDPQFLDALNNALRELEKSGELKALREKYRLQ
jgi:polar amino acid transport system substrate-binding protein